MSSPKPLKQADKDRLKYKVQVWIYRRRPSLEVLLLKLKPERGGFWQPVTGGVDEGEKIPHAALREAREETGLEFAQREPLSLQYSFRFFSPKQNRECEEHVYALEASHPVAPIQLDPHEHTAGKWVTLNQAIGELTHPSNAGNVEGLSRLVSLLQSLETNSRH